MRKTSARKGISARGRIVVLEKDEIERIEATSKRILSELGISVYSGKVSKALEDFGCSMSTDKRRILIPERPDSRDAIQCHTYQETRQGSTGKRPCDCPTIAQLKETHVGVDSGR